MALWILSQAALLFAIAIICMTRSQAAPLDTPGTITRKTRDGTADAPKWILDMFACWDKDDTEKCNSSMTGDRSSHNSSIPAADFVEMVISTEVKEGPAVAGFAQTIEFKFNVSSISGNIQRTEVRIHHQAVATVAGCDVSTGVNLKLLALSQSPPSVIDSVDVHLNHNGWVIFDSVNYDWKMGQNSVHKMAIGVAGDCQLNKLGFVFDVDDKDTLPSMMVFASQEKLMTEVKLLPSSFVNKLVEQSAGQQKRSTTNSRCHLQTKLVNLKQDLGLKNILQPDVIEMNICKGSCSDPVAHNEKNTFYAFLKAKLAGNTKGTDKPVEDPFCVPIKYRRQPILYHAQGNFYILNNAETSATDCGCR